MKFSLLIPTRKRVNLLHNLIDSINRLTNEKNSVEILVAYDDDDSITEEYIANKTNNPVNLSFYKRPRSLNINGDYYNWMAKNFAKGEYMIMINDDTIFLNPGWDAAAWAKLEEYKKIAPEGLVLGITDDQEHITNRNDHNRFTCFPLFSRTDLDVLGFTFQPEYWRDGADWVIGGVYRRVDRVLDLRKEIIIQHISVRSFRRDKDALYDEYTTLCHRCPPPPSYDVIARDTKILKHYINTKQIITPDQVEFASTGWRFIQAHG